MKLRPISKRGLLLIASGAIALLVVACGGGEADTSAAVQEAERAHAQGLLDRLPVSWAPNAITFSANPGFRQDVPVTLTTTKALTNAKIVFVPDLRNAVTVIPDTIPALAAGQSAAVTLRFAPSATDTRKVIAGIALLFDKNGTTSQPLLVKVSIVAAETINGIAVPPEPPPDLNNATLAGFDVNGNGVRDDVERYIALTYPQSARARSGLTQYAKSIQFLTVGGGTQAGYLKAINDSLDCLSATFMVSEGDVSGAMRVAATARDLKTTVLDTPIRVKSYASANMLLSGTITQGTSFEDQSARCATAPSSLPN